MVFTGKPERDKISPEMKTFAAEIGINGAAGEERGKCKRVDFMIRCDNDRVLRSLMHHNNTTTGAGTLSPETPPPAHLTHRHTGVS